MGIEKFFNSIKTQYSKENIILDTSFPYKKLNSEYVFFDFNSIIHNISERVLKKLNNEKIDNKIDNVEKYSYSYMNKLITNYVLDDLIFIIKNNFNYNNIKLIHIAIDGTPSKAKMIEQRKRRFLGNIHTLLINRETGNKKKISWSKNNISPATEFMNFFVHSLKSKKFKQRINELMINNKNFEKLVISDTIESGEAEKKILDYILDNNNIINNICLFSPDADVILLALILLKQCKNIKILRRDQQAKIVSNNINHFGYNIIDIDLIGKVLIHFIKSNGIKEIDSYKMIKDIIFLFTFFGDDFLPKLESYNVDNDIDLLLKTYSSVYKKLNNYLLENNKINIKFLGSLMELLSIKEDELIQRNYIMKNYHNYKRLKKDTDSYLKIITNHTEFIIFIKTYNFYRFLEKLEIKIKKIKKDLQNKDEKFYLNYINNNLEQFYNLGYYDEINIPNLNDIKKIINNNISFNDLLKKHTDNRVNFIYHYFKLNKFPLINNFYNINHKFRKLENTEYIGLLKYNYTLDDRFHKYNIKYLDDSKIIQYKIEHFIDEYYKKLNKEDIIKLGNLENYDKSIIDYYKINFNNKNKKLIIEEYLEGLYWINEYYFNNRLALTWFYKNTKSPLIKDISYYLKNNEVMLNKMENKYSFNNNNYSFFTNLEQLIYITPFNLNNLNNDENMNLIKYIGIDNIKKIKLFLLDEYINKLYYNNLKIVDDIFNNNNASLYCNNASYFNKCILKNEQVLNIFNDEYFINKFRKIINYDNQKFNIDISLIDIGLIYKLLKNKKNKNIINKLF